MIIIRHWSTHSTKMFMTFTYKLSDYFLLKFRRDLKLQWFDFKIPTDVEISETLENQKKLNYWPAAAWPVYSIVHKWYNMLMQNSVYVKKLGIAAYWA